MLPRRRTNVGHNPGNFPGRVPGVDFIGSGGLYSYDVAGQTYSHDKKDEQETSEGEKGQGEFRRAWRTVLVRNALFEVKDLLR